MKPHVKLYYQAPTYRYFLDFMTNFVICLLLIYSRTIILHFSVCFIKKCFICSAAVYTFSQDRYMLNEITTMLNRIY